MNVEVFPGNTADPKTFSQQVQRISERFQLRQAVFVGDRGMITSARINEDLRQVEGFPWISALRNDIIKELAEAKTVERSLFDEPDLAEVQSEDHPGERLIMCRNPFLADERARKRKELLAAAQSKLEAIVKAVSRERNPLRGKDKIGERLGRDLKDSKMSKHFETTIEDDKFTYRLRAAEVAEQAALDGVYVIGTNVAGRSSSGIPSCGRLHARKQPGAKPEHAARKTACPCRACVACWATWQRSAATRCVGAAVQPNSSE